MRETWGKPYPKTITAKKEKKPLSKVRKVTGEGKLFAEIIQERSIGGKTYSQVSAELIENPNHWNMSHLLGKGAYGLFRLRKDNIVIMTQDEHYEWEHEKSKIRDNPKWKWVFEKAEELKIEYNSNRND